MSADSAAVAFLYDLEKFGIKRGLANIRQLLSFLGNPERSYPVVHIAGTNGKGSTASMLAAILAASGYRTGLYTSPHLVEFSERIRINGEKIPGRRLGELTRGIRKPVLDLGATFFEATTAIAFRYFADSKVDVAVVETGLGGRWDATNTVHPALSIITTIGLDHQEYLGRTRARIAFEKGGIIKRGVTCITGAEDREVRPILSRIARKRSAPLILSGATTTARLRSMGLHGMKVSLSTPSGSYPGLEVSLVGEHQLHNLRLAVLGAEYLGREAGFRGISRARVREALGDVRKFSGLRARLEVLREAPLLVADVAHNPDGVRVLVRAIRRLITGRLVLVLGVMADKEYGEMLDELSPLARLVVAVAPRTTRALGTGALLSELHEKKRSAVACGSVAGGLRQALSEARPNEAVLVTGSHYTVGEALNFLNLKP